MNKKDLLNKIKDSLNLKSYWTNKQNEINNQIENIFDGKFITDTILNNNDIVKLTKFCEYFKKEYKYNDLSNVKKAVIGFDVKIADFNNEITIKQDEELQCKYEDVIYEQEINEDLEDAVDNENVSKRNRKRNKK